MKRSFPFQDIAISVDHSLHVKSNLFQPISKPSLKIPNLYITAIVRVGWKPLSPVNSQPHMYLFIM